MASYNLLMPITTHSVKTYYDQNTNLFLKFNNSKKAQNIHRSLWKDGITNLEDALNFSNSLILKEIESMNINSPQIADLGSGVGASLFYIFPRLQNPQPACGLTLSPVQAKLASNSAKELNLQNQILFAEGDFTSVPLANESLDVIYSVEAVCHAVDPEKYFREASRLLRKGGKLILVDDYLSNKNVASSNLKGEVYSNVKDADISKTKGVGFSTIKDEGFSNVKDEGFSNVKDEGFSNVKGAETAPLQTKNETKWLNAFIEGWHVSGVRTIEQTLEFANKNNLNLTKNEELTPYLRLRNLPDFLASTILFLGNLLPIKHAILPSILGSMALQQCLYMKIIEYRFLVFEKMTEDGRPQTN
jgi:SAM-dependent methyltransferase